MNRSRTNTQRSLTRLHPRLTVSCTRFAILMRGMPLFMSESLWSKPIVSMMAPERVPFPRVVE